MKGLLLVAHGSRRDASNKEFETMVSSLNKRLHKVYSKVNTSFLELSSPSIDEALHAMIAEGIDDIQVYPFFLNPGRHVHHDIPEKIKAFKTLHPEVSFDILPHFGSSEHIISLIVNDLT